MDNSNFLKVGIKIVKLEIEDQNCDFAKTIKGIKTAYKNYIKKLIKCFSVCINFNK